MSFSFSGMFFARFFIEISLCLILTLLIRTFFGRLIGPVSCRLLWIVLVIRSLVPFSIPMEFHPVGLLPEFPKWEKSLPEPVSPSLQPQLQTESDDEDSDFLSMEAFLASETGVPTLSGGVGDMTRPEDSKTGTPLSVSVRDFFGRLSLSAVVGGIWISGTLIMLFWIVSRNRQVIRLSTRKPIPVPDWVQTIFLQCREELRLGTWPVLIVSPYVGTPCLIGAIRPRILIPQKLIENHAGDHESIRYILLHELIHLKQGDIWFSWLWTLTLSLHWFNPVLWWAGRLLHFDCEAACDHRVLEKLESGKRRKYGRALLEILKKLNTPAQRPCPGMSAVVENPTNLERRLTMITRFQKQTFLRTAAGITLFVLLLTASMTGFAQQKPTPISPEKARMIGYVEDFFMNNYRDVTMRKSLEWGDVVTDDQGNSTIRYKCEALIWDKDRMIMCEDFTFDKDGNFVSSNKVEGFPQEKEKPDTSTKKGMQQLVEKFFSQNYRDITKRETLEWGEPQTLKNGNRSIRYKYKATIWDKDVITQNKIFTFDKDGEFVSVKDVKDTEGQEIENTSSVLAANAFIKDLAEGEFEKALTASDETFKEKASGQIETIWKGFIKSYGAFVKSEAIKVEEVPPYQRVHERCTFERGTAVFMVVVDGNDRVSGFFIASTDKKQQKNEVKKPKKDTTASQKQAQEGWKLFTQGNAAEAEKKFQAAIESDAQNANAYQGLGWAQMNVGNQDKAKKTFEKCLELDPKNTAALNGLGQIAYYMDNDEEAAIQHWEKAISLDKRATGPMLGLASLYEMRDDYANAVKYYQMWVKCEPQNQDAQKALKAAQENLKTE